MILDTAERATALESYDSKKKLILAARRLDERAAGRRFTPGRFNYGILRRAAFGYRQLAREHY